MGTELKRAFCSVKYLLSVAGITLMCFISTKNYLKGDEITAGYIMDLMINLSIFKKIIVFFSALPFAGAFCEDYTTRFSNLLISRYGEKKYIFYKVITCAFSSFAANVTGIILFAVLISLKSNSYGSQNAGELWGYEFHDPVAYLISAVIVFSLYCTVWSVSGLAMSAVIPDKYVALGSPIVFSYLIEELTCNLPVSFNLYKLSHGGIVFDGHPVMCGIYTATFFITSIVFAGIVFLHYARRRLRNELV